MKIEMHFTFVLQAMPDAGRLIIATIALLVASMSNVLIVRDLSFADLPFAFS